MRNPSTFILMIWFTVACLMPSAGGVRGVVLCFSSQGHVVFEAEHLTPDCESVCKSTVDEQPTCSDTDSHRCFDLSLSRIDMRPNRARAANLHPEITQASSPFSHSGQSSIILPWTDRYRVARFGVPTEWFRVGQRRALRTIILRI